MCDGRTFTKGAGRHCLVVWWAVEEIGDVVVSADTTPHHTVMYQTIGGQV